MIAGPAAALGGRDRQDEAVPHDPPLPPPGRGPRRGPRARPPGGSGRLRVVAGEARGRPLVAPAGHRLRPTTGLVRGACFDILGAEVVGARVLDLYAGAGSLGIEAISRGARTATFVERDRLALECLQANLERLGFDDRGSVVRAAVVPWLRTAPRLADHDLILCDPPYLATTGVEPTGELVDALAILGRRLLADAAAHTVVCEHHRAVTLPSRVGALECVRAARYGMTTLTFYRRAE